MNNISKYQSCLDNARVGDRVLISWSVNRGFSTKPFIATVIKNEKGKLFIANNDNPRTLFGERAAFSGFDIPISILHQFRCYAYCAVGAFNYHKIFKQ